MAVIKHISLKHGWFYHYRLHEERLKQVPHEALKNYLNSVFEDCPEEPFITGPRSSSMRLDLGISPSHIQGHELCEWARLSEENTAYKTAHSRVQITLLNRDEKTLGVEIPIWINTNNSKILSNYFESTEDKNFLSGHIDLLRVENNKIWIWDYKPKAVKEKFATTQTFFYALMLSKRSNIPLENFLCGYFDEKDAFIFDPNKCVKEEVKQKVII